MDCHDYCYCEDCFLSEERNEAIAGFVVHRFYILDCSAGSETRFLGRNRISL
ncbi:zinc-finger domain-containing protein [Microcoleus sp. PH2017_22_RUC_O_B]|uniref:zinc-finger domain-containing protein n=1 Tax=unclassified Microcoleus TaxID=2642155 RepID=UPI003451B309